MGGVEKKHEGSTNPVKNIKHSLVNFNKPAAKQPTEQIANIVLCFASLCFALLFALLCFALLCFVLHCFALLCSLVVVRVIACLALRRSSTKSKLLALLCFALRKSNCDSLLCFA